MYSRTLTVTNNLGVALLRDQQAERAAEKLEIALENRNSTLGKDHQDTLSSQKNLGLAYLQIDRHAEGFRLMSTALESQKKVARNYTR